LKVRVWVTVRVMMLARCVFFCVRSFASSYFGVRVRVMYRVWDLGVRGAVETFDDR